MDLRLDYKFAAKTGRHIFCLFGCMRDGTRLGGHTKFRKKFAGLKFVDIHIVSR